MSKNDLRIEVLGTELTISTDEEPEYLNKLLEKYREKIEHTQRVTGLKDPLKTAILTGFLLCDDMEKAGSAPANAGNEEPCEVERLTLGMISRLGELIPDTPVSTEAETTVKTEAEAAADTSVETAAETVAETAAEFTGKKPGIFKLQNQVKNYEWGSTEWIPVLLGKKNVSRIPWAELWLGVHPAGPSRVIQPEKDPANENGPLLSEVAGTLPFMMKVLAAAKPLSIQVHPNREQAREGFDRENKAGLPSGSPKRNYSDPNPKSEIICALSPFAALCGFRSPEEIRAIIGIIHAITRERALREDLESLLFALKQENPLRSFLSALYKLEKETFISVAFFIKNEHYRIETEFYEYKNEWKLCTYLSKIFPGDSGIIAPLFLNLIELNPGEAIYIPSGTLHSYINGLGIELMSNSDNVLRGGLSSKHMDKDELLRILKFSKYKPEIMKLPDPAPSRFSYPAPAGDFVLSVINGSDTPIAYRETEPSIVIATEGSAALSADGFNAINSLSRGESVFIPAGMSLEFSGFREPFTAYSAAAKA